jgi:ligand-binding SRPBCC domain-containing protein
MVERAKRARAKREYDVTVIEKRALIRRPPSEIFAFMDRPSNWKSAFPDSLAVRLEEHPSDLRPGTIFRYRLHRWPVDVSWDVVVSEYRPPTRYTNVKARGYFPRWVLEHEIVPNEAGAELVMRLSYEVPDGIYAALSNNYVIREAMDELVSANVRAVSEAIEGVGARTPAEERSRRATS